MTAELNIRRLGHKGDGIADGPVIVPNALPGEVVSGEIVQGRLQNSRIVTPSPDRITPPCRHANSCGGCQLQHGSDAFLESWKMQVVRSALEARGLHSDILPIHISPPGSRRRATFAARRTKKGALAGFYGKASDVIVEIPDCILLRPALTAARPLAGLLAQIGASRKHALAVTMTDSDAGVDVAAKGGKPLDASLRIELAELAETHDLSRLAWNGETVVTRRPPIQTFGDAIVVPPPGAFLQATREGQDALVADVLDVVGDCARIVDLFSGCGTFALPLAQRSSVHAVEGDPAMTLALDQAWRQATGLRALSVETRDLFRRPLEPDELSRFDAAVIDPPRAGAEAQIHCLARSDIQKIVYVSCNPQSFARDARHLVSAGFGLKRLRVVDQFRWSTHVELVAELTRQSVS